MYSFFQIKKYRDNNEFFPKIEVIITNYIWDNHKIIPNLSIKELAQRCNTSTSTVSRFSRRINSSDLKTLKEKCKVYNNSLEKKKL